MDDEEVKPVEEVVETPTETPQEETPIAAAEETAEEKPVEAEPEKKEEVVEPPKEDWRDKELKAKHRKTKELERQLDEERKRREIAEAIAAKAGQSGEAPVSSGDEVERKAKELLAQQQYIDNCNKAAQSGESTYGENWKGAIENLEVLGGFDTATMNGVLATDDPARVLFELGRNPDNYHRIMALPYEKRIIEMGKLALQQSNSKPVSNAPAPVSPVGGRAAPASATLKDDLDDDKWYAIRTAQKRAKWKANQVQR